MRPKIRIRRGADGWTVLRPRLGVGPPERRTFPTQPEALRWATGTIPRGGTAFSQGTELADPPHWWANELA